MPMTPAEEHLKYLMELFRKDFAVERSIGMTPHEWRENVNKAANEIVLRNTKFSQIDLNNKNRKRRVA